jgi:hypothetical protein
MAPGEILRGSLPTAEAPGDVSHELLAPKLDPRPGRPTHIPERLQACLELLGGDRHIRLVAQGGSEGVRERQLLGHTVTLDAPSLHVVAG